MNCGSCVSDLYQLGKLKRYDLGQFASPNTVEKVFPNLSSRFVCGLCLNKFRSVTVPVGKRRTSGRRRWKSPIQKLTQCSPYDQHSYCKRPRICDEDHAGGDTDVADSLCESEEPIPPGQGNFKDSAISYITQSKYAAAFKLLCEGSDSARAALIGVASEMISTEMKLCQQHDKLRQLQQCNEGSLKTFNWKVLHQQLKQTLPVWMSSLDAALQQREGEDEIITARMGLITGIVLHTNAPRKFKFLQATMAVELWCQGASHKLFSSLNHLGISLGVNASRAYVDQLAEGHDKVVKCWTSDIMSNKAANGFSICWDNVQITSEAKHQNSDSGNKFIIWALTFAVENRVPTLIYAQDQARIPAAALNPAAFLPGQEDLINLQSRMKIIIMRHLVDIIPFLAELQPFVNRHVTHKQSDNMAKKSIIANTGLVEGNPGSTDGTAKVMRHVQQHVPCVNGQLFPIMCSGDGATVRGMTRAKKASANGQLKSEGNCRFSGLVEGPQEFHKEGLLLQDMMDRLFCPSSQPDRGTLANLKQAFNHRSVKQKVMTNYQHVWDFLKFATIAYVASLFLELAGMKDMTAPPSYPAEASISKKLQWLQNMACGIVKFVWMPFPAVDVVTATKAYYQPGLDEDDIRSIKCVCMEEKDENLVTCSNRECRIKEYHQSCVTDYSSTERWYCSLDCRAQGTCHCGEEKDDQVVECGAAEKCVGNRTYHTHCVNDAVEQGIWYCSEQCKLYELTNDDDEVLSYSKLLVWEGLNALARRDAVREGDGETMVSHWKLDMLNFWSNRHPMYFKIGQQFLANVAGFLPQRLQQDLIWNRVGSINGKVGGNIPLDLINEFLNNEFKEMLKRSRGMYTSTQVKRCAEMSGAYGKHISKVLSTTSLHAEGYNSSSTKAKVLTKDVIKFIKEYQEDSLWSYCPGRKHGGMKKCVSPSVLRSPAKLGETLQSLCIEMDTWKILFKIPDQ